MTMRITDISLRNFRNYEDFRLNDLGDLTIFIGQNGIGKTNILEALQLMTSGASFRHPQIVQLIREGASNAHVEIKSTDGNRHITTALALEVGKKRYSVNGKAKSLADVKGTLPAVVFTPDDLQLAKKSSSVKRTALDEVGSQLTRNYHVVLNDYEKTLRYKNRLLKDEAPRDLISAIDETLITCGSQLFCYRVALFTRMLPLLQQSYAELSDGKEAFSVNYVPSWDHLSGLEASGAEEPGLLTNASLSVRENGAPDRDQVRDLLAERLAQHAAEEAARKRSLVGPHNDKISFFLAGRDASSFASQGQQRSIVLAWKLAEMQLVQDMLGVNPVLLLDDVMSELDATRRETLVRFTGAGMQTFITATDLDGFNPALLEQARVVKL